MTVKQGALSQMERGTKMKGQKGEKEEKGMKICYIHYHLHRRKVNIM